MRGKTTLRTNTTLLDCIFMRLTSALGDPIGGLIDASDHFILILELREFRGDDAENDVLVLWKMGQRLETTCTRRVVFEIVCVDIEVLKRSIQDEWQGF